MKKIACSILIIAAVGCNAQIRPTPHDWRATLNVVDDTGQPVVGAEVRVGFAIAPPPDESTASDKIVGLTDANGVFVASHRDQSVYLSFQARKAGHYSFGVQHNIGFSPQDHPERLNTSATLTLKRIIKPIPMYARWVKSGPPTYNKPVGFDLIAGDWVGPYGKGASTDVIFTGHLDKRNENDSDYKLVVTFPNPGDGIQEFTAPALPTGEGSGLRSPHEAPADGYQPQLIRDQSRHPGQPDNFDYEPNRNYFFRVRTVLDEKGNVKSALYGKIYGDLMKFRYYLNPKPNDRNVEFDPRQNLLNGLKSTEQVDAP